MRLAEGDPSPGRGLETHPHPIRGLPQPPRGTAVTGEETALLRVSEAGGETDLRTAIGAAGTQSRGDRSQTHAPGTPQALSQETHWEPPLLDPGVTPAGQPQLTGPEN